MSYRSIKPSCQYPIAKSKDIKKEVPEMATSEEDNAREIDRERKILRKKQELRPGAGGFFYQHQQRSQKQRI